MELLILLHTILQMRGPVLSNFVLKATSYVAFFKVLFFCDWLKVTKLTDISLYSQHFQQYIFTENVKKGQKFSSLKIIYISHSSSCENERCNVPMVNITLLDFSKKETFSSFEISCCFLTN